MDGNVSNDVQRTMVAGEAQRHRPGCVERDESSQGSGSSAAERFTAGSGKRCAGGKVRASILVHPQKPNMAHGNQEPGTRVPRLAWQLSVFSNPSESSFTLFLPHPGLAMSQPRTDPAKRGLLSEREIYWRERHDWLKERGFELRPRFRPGWTPSWKGTNRTIISCEDGMRLMVCAFACL